MNSEFANEQVTFTFDFSKPVLVPDFTIGDIDYSGYGAGSNEEPHDSFQDEVELSAARGGIPVGFTITPLGGTDPVVTGPASVAGDYTPGVNGNLGPEDVNGTVELSTLEPVTTFSFAYSSGPDEAASETPNLPAPAPLDPAADSVSNNHAIRVNVFTACTGTLTIGDTVFADVDGDGVHDAGEPGLSGVTVTLSDDNAATIATTTTDGSGNYSFTELTPYDNWIVTVTLPSGYTNTGDRDATADGTTIIDNSAGANVSDADFALEPPAGTISGSVISDRNDNGALDAAAGDTALAGAGLSLSGTDLAGNSVSASTTTATDGTYSFAGIPAGSYTVTETTPTGYDDGIDTPGTNAVSGGNDVSSITLGLGDSSVGNDFAEVPAASLAGSVFEDTDNDGTKDGGESGISGVAVALTGTDDGGNAVSFATSTAGDGTYSFDKLRAGTYSITETQPGSHLDGIDSAGTAGGSTAIDDVVSSIALGLGVDATGYDFGELTSSSISGSVTDDGANGIANVTVTLTGTDDLLNPISEVTTTDGSGNYSFAGLRPGTYAVTETQPTGYGDGGETAGTAGGDDGTDDIISAITLASDTSATGYDFDETRGSIAGSVTDDGANGIANVTITLTGTDDLTNPVSQATTTAADGTYSFTGLISGTYTVTETQPTGYGDGGEDAGTAGGDDGTDDIISAISLAGGEDATGYDFDETRASLAGVVFEDDDNDGTQDVGEDGIAGVTVTLTGTDDLTNPVSETTTTAADGTYSFTGLISGTYTITETQAAGYGDGADTAGTAGGDAATVDDEVSAISLGGGEAATGYTFGELVPSTISGSVFEDDDNDGTQDVGEDGIAGVTITLTGTNDLGNPVSQTTTTDSSGDYSFPGLRPGTYTVAETQPGSHLDGIDSAGSGGGDAVTVNDETSGIVLGASGSIGGYDFAELVPASISGSVTDDEGSGIANVTVTLTGTDDLGNPVSVTTTTDGSGDYSFPGLRPGTYTLTETQPAEYGDGGETAGNGGGNDSVDDTISAIALTAGATLAGYDFDEQRGSIAGSVWADTNANAVHDAGEVGVSGVTVTLTGVNDLGDPVILVAATDAAGNYLFDGLLSGSYKIVETQPANLADGADVVGTAGGTAGVVNDEISAIALGAGEHATGYDFGELAYVISGTTWIDTDGDGIADPEETEGLAGVSVTLYDGGVAIATTTTAADGSYSFPPVPAGTYTIEQTQPARLARAPPTP